MEPENKKVLIITYYWPPAGGPGVQRWLKFVKYLPKYGIQPIVYIPDNPTYPIIDNDLLKEVSSSAVILRNKIFEPYQLASFFSKNKTKKISSGIIPNTKKQSVLDKIFLWIRNKKRNVLYAILNRGKITFSFYKMKSFYFFKMSSRLIAIFFLNHDFSFLSLKG